MIYYFLLLCIWIDSKLETLCIHHFLTSFRNYVCMYILSHLQETYNWTARKIISIFYFVHRQMLTQIRWTRLISPCLKTGVLRRFLITFSISHPKAAPSAMTRILFCLNFCNNLKILDFPLALMQWASPLHTLLKDTINSLYTVGKIL